MRIFTGWFIAVLLILAAASAPAAEPAQGLEDGERLYTQEDMARLVAEALAAERGEDPEALA
ncbi:MAG TPA: hypothetical protein PK694_07900, partial [Rhodospirillales bacterium]|nr:hypothetical protein [Rhodospirillales bacterium]